MYASLSIQRLRHTVWSRRVFPHPWVARLVELDDHWGFQRDFVQGVIDYSRAPHEHWLYYALAPGLYEVFYPVSNRADRRYFARVSETGDITEIDREEVVQCLKSICSE